MNKIAQSGFSLLEMMIVVTILGIVATVTLPLLGSNDPQKLNVAAEETANTLRFALSEAKRTGGYVLVDGISTANQLNLYYSDNTANVPPTAGISAIINPLTKRSMNLNVGTSTFSRGVTLTPQFVATDGKPFLSLLIGPGLSQLQSVDKIGEVKSILSSGSGVLLVLGSQSVLVSINEKTGLVTLP